MGLWSHRDNDEHNPLIAENTEERSQEHGGEAILGVLCDLGG